MKVGNWVSGAPTRCTIPPSWSVEMTSGQPRCTEPCSVRLADWIPAVLAMLSPSTITPARWYRFTSPTGAAVPG